MKKIVLALCLLLSFPLFAQDKEKAKLQSKVAKSDTEIADAKKGVQPKTWINRAELFMDVWAAPTGTIMLGMANKDIKLVLAKEKIQESLSEELGGVIYEIDVYNDKKLYYSPEGLLAFWQVTGFAVENPLFQALDAYKRAAELDTKGSSAKKIKEGLALLKNNFNTDALSAYTRNDYAEALRNFEGSLACSAHPLIAQTDSVIVYYSGLVARANGDNLKAADYFKQAVDMGYVENGDMYALYAEVLMSTGDSVAAQAALGAGMEKFPTNQSIIVGLINLFLQKGEDPKKILPYVHKAQENDAENATLYYAEGLVYEQLGDSDSAAKAYVTAIEKDPDNFFANYGLGALYYNEAVKTSQMAADEVDDKRYEVLMKRFDSQIKQAVPYLEKAYELNPSERAVLESLKTIYFRLREESPEMQQKHDFYNEKLQSM